MDDKAKLLLHPVRIRIIQALIGRERTVQRLQEWSPDIPSPTLYRRLQTLTGAGILRVVGTKQVRGAVEKTYALAEHGSELSEEELKRMNPDDHMRSFITFLSHLIGEFGEYTGQKDMDMRRDGAGYRVVNLYLSDSEFKQMAEEIRLAVHKHLNHPPSPERRRFSLATILIPGSPNGAGETSSDEEDQH
ncbi:helix-turn-helix domain-containing protein [Paenibacillus sp. P25]|nr:helix-turn-helix domain-containing protein [Paenibacillus sp. P25]